MRRNVELTSVWATCLGLLVVSTAVPESALRAHLDLSFSGKPLIEKPVTVADRAAHAAPPGSRIRLCTYNIQHFTDGHDDWVDKTAAQSRAQARHAAALISRIDPDLIFIQEIENARVLKWLNAAMAKPYPLAYITDFGSEVGRDVSLNIALLSRLPVKGVREIDFGGLVGEGRPPRGFLSGFIALGGVHRLLVYGVHLKANVGERGANYAKRWNALRILRADAERLRKRYESYVWEVVVMGDMNVDPDSPDFGDDPTFQPLIDWVDLWLGRPIETRTTIPPRGQGEERRFSPQGFDRFIVSNELVREPWLGVVPKVVSVGVDTENRDTVPGESRSHISDHFPVYMDVLRHRHQRNDGRVERRVIESK